MSATAAYALRDSKFWSTIVFVGGIAAAMVPNKKGKPDVSTD